MTLKDRLAKIYNDNYEKIKQRKITNYYNKGGINLLSKHLYKLDIYSYSSLINKDIEMYKAISSSIFEYVENRLKQKEVINVGFVIHSASMWSCEELYRLFEQDSRFNPSVIVSRCNSDANLNTYPLYNKTLEFFKSGNYNIKTLSLSDNRQTCWKKMGKPDLLFYLSPYNLFTPKEINIKYMPADILTIYIPYCYMMNDDVNLRRCPGIMYTWRHFVEAQFYVDILGGEFPYRKKNIVFLGYPKMDYFYRSDYKDDLWKDSSNLSKKRIIYAPHHSIGYFSTFQDNYLDILKLAQKYQEYTTWIIKPHPLLGMETIRKKIFSNNEEYEKYLNEWRKLENANVVEEGTYEDIFMTSDAMICDSISFLAEYQFTHKPLLFLQNKKELNFDKFGLDIYNQLYHTDGKNIQGIEKYILEVVINGKDTMKEQRSVFFNRYLNKKGKKSSSYYIYEYLRNELSM